MRPLHLGKPTNTDPNDGFQRWVMECMAEIERAADEDVARIARDFTTDNVTATRTLDPTTATTADVANVLATLIEDLCRRGMKRRQ